MNTENTRHPTIFVQLGNQWKAWFTMHFVQQRRILSRNMEIKLYFYFRALVEYILPWPFRSIVCIINTIVNKPDVKFTDLIEFYVVPIFDKESLKISIVVSLTSYLNTLNRFCCLLLQIHCFIQFLFTVIDSRESAYNFTEIDLILTYTVFCAIN